MKSGGEGERETETKKERDRERERERKRERERVNETKLPLPPLPWLDPCYCGPDNERSTGLQYPSARRRSFSLFPLLARTLTSLSSLSSSASHKRPSLWALEGGRRSAKCKDGGKQKAGSLSLPGSMEESFAKSSITANTYSSQA